MKIRLVFLLAFTLLCLGSCVARTALQASTVFDVRFSLVSAGNMALTEWQIIPPDYEDYLGSYIKTYSFRFYHDGSVTFSATYGFTKIGEDKPYCEEENGSYTSITMGPGGTISVSLPSRETLLTWEPNPRDPTGSLVFRIWEHRTMTFDYIDEDHPAITDADLYVVLRSESISPRPI